MLPGTALFGRRDFADACPRGGAKLGNSGLRAQRAGHFPLSRRALRRALGRRHPLGYTSSMIRPGAFHSLADARSWALHREIARRVAAEPQLLENAKRRVAAWQRDPSRHPYAEAWLQLLEGDLGELEVALCSTDEPMCTLRQASPFAGALDSATRWRILKQPELRGREAG